MQQKDTSRAASRRSGCSSALHPNDERHMTTALLGLRAGAGVWIRLPPRPWWRRRGWGWLTPSRPAAWPVPRPRVERVRALLGQGERRNHRESSNRTHPSDERAPRLHGWQALGTDQLLLFELPNGLSGKVLAHARVHIPLHLFGHARQRGRSAAGFPRRTCSGI
jgi:hypothetical protein